MSKKWIYSGTQENDKSKRELIHQKIAKEAAIEGIVLLKNEGILPLRPKTPIALLGSGAKITVKGGTGSGDVNNRENVSIYDGLKKENVPIISENWIFDYQMRYEKSRQVWKEKICSDAQLVDNPFDAYTANSFSFPEGRDLNQTDIQGAKVAVYVINRISGEGKDRRREPGDYYLSKKEEKDLLFLNEKKLPIVLIINSGGPVELTDILEKASHINAILNISQLGQEGGHAVADILTGKSVPSGKLTTTWAKHYEDYPYAQNFGYLNGNLEEEEYKEGIFVGYRYFNSCGIQPLFPFGYGLSYTNFSIECVGIEIRSHKIDIKVTVENSGTLYSGKEVIQIYVTPPQNSMAKEYKRLVGFKKSHTLKPKEKEELTITIDQKQMASFSQQAQGWEIESGIYGIWVGNHIDAGNLSAFLNVSESKIIEKTNPICPLQKELSELNGFDYTKQKINEMLQMGQYTKVKTYAFVPQSEEQKQFSSVSAKTQPIKELIPLLYGNITKGASTLGSAGIRVPGSAGETSECLEEKYNKSSLIMADGPAGIRLRQSYQVDTKTGDIHPTGVFGSLENGFLDEKVHYDGADTYYQYCTAFPVGTALAQTWNTAIIRKVGKAVSVEMEEFFISIWLAPGMNIHRNPLCGRNFEYFSEDPYLSGIMASEMTKAVQSNSKCGVTIKHFACNNQEDNRMGVNVCVSERALRELYFRGFEIAIKTSNPVAMMSSYNLINGIHAANHKDLCSIVARKEWGFQGVIMSDWNTTVPKDGSIPWKCTEAGNDIIMPGNEQDHENIYEAYLSKKLSEDTIRESAGRIIAMIDRLTNQ